MRFTFIFVAVLCVTVTSGLTTNAIREAVRRCTKHATVPGGSFDYLLRTRRIPHRRDEKCFVGCLYRDIGVTKNGVVDYDLTKNLIASKYSAKPDQLRMALDVLEKCKFVMQDDECEMGSKLRECIISNSDGSFIPYLKEIA